MSETVRTFIAIELPQAVRQCLAQRQRELRAAGGNVRWVRPERMHLTLVFLGDVGADRLEALEAAARGACAGFGPLALRVGGAGRFPPKGRPRVVWSGIDEPTGRLEALQAELARATAPFAEKTEKRAYHAHLTLGRVRGGNPRPLGDAVAALAQAKGPEFTADEVLIIKSLLTPQGPEYSVLARLPLEGGGG